MPASQQIDEADSSNGSKSAWKKATAVVQLVKASQGFKTLRDMVPQDNIIESSQLKITGPLGEGGFAFVNLALLGDRQVAVKTLKPELLQDPTEIQLFLQETTLMKKIRHPYIVELIGVGGKTGSGSMEELFIVQEFCSGGSLRELVFKQMTTIRKLLYSHAEALRWSLNVAKALKYLHAAKPKIVHRDIKLENCLLTDVNPTVANAKLADFGLAKLVSVRPSSLKMQTEVEQMVSTTQEAWTTFQRQRSMSVERTLEKMDSMMMSMNGSTRSSLNRPPTFSEKSIFGNEEMTGECGSYAYMSPECLLGQQYDEKSDIFSLAMLMYNLFYRVIPSVLFLNNGGVPEDLALLALKTANGYRPKLSQTAVPQEINALIERCWHGVPELRPSAEEIVKTLEEIEALGVCKPLPQRNGILSSALGGGRGSSAAAGKAGCSCSLM